MKKKYPLIDLPPDLQAFRARFLAATEVEGTMCGVTFYKMRGLHFARAQSSLTGQQVKKDKRFRRTLQQAAVLAMAAKYVTPIYNGLTEDWRCHDLYRKLVGLGIRLLHQGHTKEGVQQAVYTELERLGYRTEWPVWQLPPNLAKWMEEESVGGSEPGVVSPALRAGERASVCKESFIGAECRHAPYTWIVNHRGKLQLAVTVDDHSHISSPTASIAAGFLFHDSEVAEPP